MIALIKHTGEYKTVTEEVETEKGLETVERQEEILETVKTYEAEDETDLLYRAKLTAEIKTRDTGYRHDAKVV